MPGDSIQVQGHRLRFQGKEYACAIGKGGFSDRKREGDGATPLGIFPLRECWYRADRIASPRTKLMLHSIAPDDGWCDDPASPHYNRQVKLPFAASHERLWREDGRYDLLVPLGYNDGPVKPGAGSAIFLHVAAADYTPTEGCVALARENMLDVLARCGLETVIRIMP